MDIARNAGPDELELGDVAAVVGVDGPVLGEIPVMRIVKATADNASAVVGVVDQRFLVQQDEEGEQFVQPDGDAASYAAGTGVQAEEYVSIVTLGAYKQIKVDASFGSIQPGDLLTPSPNPGYAMRAADPEAGDHYWQGASSAGIGARHAARVCDGAIGECRCEQSET